MSLWRFNRYCKFNIGKCNGQDVVRIKLLQVVSLCNMPNASKRAIMTSVVVASVGPKSNKS